jgi:large subunit ribosomal protein L3
MNTHLGLIGKKLGCSQVFLEDGNVLPVSVIVVGPCTVVGIRTKDKDGYTALVLGFGEKREKLVNNAQIEAFKKIKQKPTRFIREFRLPETVVAAYKVGQTLKPSDIFEVGQRVDVTGTSKGLGFTGVMRRWGMPGARKDTHGTHEYKRHGGSIGCNMTPGRTLPGLKMPGQDGNRRNTVVNLEVVKVIDKSWAVLIKGAVPGSRNGIVTVRGSTRPARPVRAAQKKAA